MNTFENYVYKKEVDWSLLIEGITLPVDNQVVFARNMGKFLKRGETKNITLYLDGKGYSAQIRNIHFDSKFNRKNDTLQIRYPKYGELSGALCSHFKTSYEYIKTKRQMRTKTDRTMVKLPDNNKEYLAIYTTEYEDSYILETIEADDIIYLKKTIQNYSERTFETIFNFDVEDKDTDLFQREKIVKIRKLNKKISDNLKLLYNFRCQICGQHIGKNYGAHAVEAHHIDYFVKSINNDSRNQLIVCPNHHSIIHQVNPSFNREKLIYLYANGYEEGLKINKHL